MPRKPNPARVAEYARLCEFLFVATEYCYGAKGGGDAVGTGAESADHTETVAVVLDLLRQGIEANEVYPLSIRIEGARQAINDLLEQSRFLSPRQVAELDALLEARGCETLSAARTRLWNDLDKVLRRGRIRTEREYYSLVERLNDGVTPLDDELQAYVAQLAEDFENRAAKRRRPSV